MIVLDTNVLSEPLTHQADDHVLAWFASLDEEAGVTSISIGELLTGVRALPVGRRRDGLLEAIESTLRTFAGSVLAYDEAAARQYARLQESRRAAGRPLAVEDGMIAAICVVRGTALATRNTADFVGLGLDLIDPWSTSGWPENGRSRSPARPQVTCTPSDSASLTAPPRSSVTPSRCASARFVPISSASVRSAPARTAPRRSADVRSAPRRSVPVRRASTRSAWARRSPPRSMSARSTPRRFTYDQPDATARAVLDGLGAGAPGSGEGPASGS